MKKEALFYSKLDNNKVECLLCPHHCIINPGQKGLCRVRENEDGHLYTGNYGEIAALAVDPIEKKPLFHFYPGSLILSAGTWGCNLSCGFCQNYSLAHQNPGVRELDTNRLVEIAHEAKKDGSVGLAFTYNEPSIWYEYVLETAIKLKGTGLQVVLVTNGYIEIEPLRKLLPYVDAFNIDVKGFTRDFYHKNCKGKLEAVKKTVENVAERAHLEITTLLIPGENEDYEEISALSKWIASLDTDIPLHLSRYYPAYYFVKEPTSPETLMRAREIAREYLNFVYLGNLPGEANNTYCKNCGQLLVRRNGYATEIIGLQDGKCQACGNDVLYIINKKFTF